jgi:hypothetical protein
MRRSESASRPSPLRGSTSGRAWTPTPHWRLSAQPGNASKPVTSSPTSGVARPRPFRDDPQIHHGCVTGDHLVPTSPLALVIFPSPYVIARRPMPAYPHRVDLYRYHARYHVRSSDARDTPFESTEPDSGPPRCVSIPMTVSTTSANMGIRPQGSFLGCGAERRHRPGWSHLAAYL